MILFNRTILTIKIIEITLNIILELLCWNLKFTERYKCVEVTIALTLAITILRIFCLHRIGISLARVLAQRRLTLILALHAIFILVLQQVASSVLTINNMA